ncbi:MAG: RtcB family protein [Desulfobulbaceae bacterium]|nr:RtcB family protein [Desulfobulbaceae bacterium]
METIFEGKLPILSWVPYQDLESGALQQAYEVASLPYTFKHVALMPDCHRGYGVPIGGVLATKDVVIPNAVGVDIGCGVQVCRLPIHDLSREQVQMARKGIRKVVPTGFRHHKRGQKESYMPDGHDSLEIVGREYQSARKQLGTLGGGNHFIELQKGNDGWIYIMIHSGSRNLGLKVAKHYRDIAKELRIKKEGIVKDLSYLKLNTDTALDYLKEMDYCVRFAHASRSLMMNRCIEVLESIMDFDGHRSRLDIAHNYASEEVHFGERVLVHRKGATSAYDGELGIIPGDIGSSSFIVEGLGNADSFCSCSHGAGRVLGRAKAKDTLDLDEEMKKLDDQGIVHDIRSRGKLDEAIGAYKDIQDVMKNQRDLVKIKVELKPLGSIKA